MNNKIAVYLVKSLTAVDTTNYKQGDIFITNRSVGILVNDKIRTFEFDKPDLSEYVKKDEVQKMIEKAVKNNG